MSTSEPLLIECAIMTVARLEPYLHLLLDGWPPALPVRLVVGSLETGYLQRFQAQPNLEVLVPPAGEWSQMRDQGVHQRAAWNYWRCLRLGGVQPGRHGLVVLEDDVLLCRTWRERLQATIRQLDADFGPGYALALYSAYGPAAPEPSKDYVPYDIASFYGTQAMYFPEPMRAGFAAYLKQHGVDTFRTPYDLLLKDYLTETGGRLFRSMPVLAQHIGRVSTGLGCFHQTDGFSTAL